MYNTSSIHALASSDTVEKDACRSLIFHARVLMPSPRIDKLPFFVALNPTFYFFYYAEAVLN